MGRAQRSRDRDDAPRDGTRVRLTSTFVGHQGVPTHATHLTLGPPAHAAVLRTDDHQHAILDPAIPARACAYDRDRLPLPTRTRPGTLNGHYPAFQ